MDRIQAAFGRHDVTDARAHTDAGARDASDRMGAEGYATGRDVGFNSTLTIVKNDVTRSEDKVTTPGKAK